MAEDPDLVCDQSPRVPLRFYFQMRHEIPTEQSTDE